MNNETGTAVVARDEEVGFESWMKDGIGFRIMYR